MIFPYRLRHVVTQMATGTRQQDKVDKDDSGKIRCESCSKLRFCPILPRALWFISPLSSCGKTKKQKKNELRGIAAPHQQHNHTKQNQQKHQHKKKQKNQHNKKEQAKYH